MKSLIIGERYKDKLEKPLESHGFRLFWLPENPNIDPRLASHSDLSVFVHNKTAVVAEYLANNKKLVNFLTTRGYSTFFSSIQQNKTYPEDINLCALPVGNLLLHNTAYTDAAIKDNILLDMIHINQGYARCTALTVDKQSIITSDRGIAEAAERAGLDVLIINKGGVVLDGFAEGFIGGAAFKAENTIYFTGDIDRHPDAYEIRAFIIERGIECVCLTDGALFDIGGAVYVN